LQLQFYQFIAAASYLPQPLAQDILVSLLKLKYNNNQQIRINFLILNFAKIQSFRENAQIVNPDSYRNQINLLL